MECHGRIEVTITRCSWEHIVTSELSPQAGFTGGLGEDCMAFHAQGTGWQRQCSRRRQPSCIRCMLCASHCAVAFTL